MKYIHSTFLIFFISICSASQNKTKTNEVPFRVKTDLFDETEKDSLGLRTPIDLETISIFEPNDKTDHFSNGAVMTVFKDVFYCQWQSSAKDEDSEDTWVAYSRSEDGKNWSQPMVLSESLDNGYCTSGGWWKSGDTLVAYINQWPSNVKPKGGFTYYKMSIDGINWTKKKLLLKFDGKPLKGVFEQDPHQLANGRIINAAHFQPGLIVSPIYTDDPMGISGWIRANFKNISIKKDVSREIEPSSFLQSDSTIVMIFRDQNSSHKSIASVSFDRGENWSMPIVTNMPDARSKQSAANISSEISYIVNNPIQSKSRMPLVVTLSRGGEFFDTAYSLRKAGNNIQAMRFEGKYKKLGYHYPKSIIWKNHLYVSYTTNKEDVEYTKVPLSSLILN